MLYINESHYYHIRSSDLHGYTHRSITSLAVGILFEEQSNEGQTTVQQVSVSTTFSNYYLWQNIIF